MAARSSGGLREAGPYDHERASRCAIGRRFLLRVLAGGLLVVPCSVLPQPSGRLRRVGYLDQGSAAGSRPYVDAFRQGMRELGWIEGENLELLFRFADGVTDALPRLAGDLVREKVHLIVTWSTPAALAAKHASKTIPIVIGFTADPVGSGIVASLARPGGNVTGWTHVGLELRAKYLDLLKEAVPDAKRVGVLWNPSNQVHKPSLQVLEAAAHRLDVQLELAGVSDPEKLDGTFTNLAARGVQGLIVFPDGMFVAQKARIIALAARERLPALYGIREYAQAGGLLFYGADLAEMQRRVGATLADKILKGARPAELPVERPTRFELVVNQKTARALGLTLPQSLLLQANEVIQ